MKIKQKLLLSIGIVLLLVMSSSFYYIYTSQENQVEDNYYNHAKSISRDISMVRHTFVMQGGVYVKKSESIQTNPYLQSIPNLKVDIEDTSGVEYTMLNGFTFIQQMADGLTKMDQINEEEKYSYRVPSKLTLNPRNTPDEKELLVLDRFESGEIEEYASIEKDETGQRVYRYMTPVFSEKKCLKCHDYGQMAEGLGIVGALSLTFPIESTELAKEAHLKNILLFFLGSSLMIMGLVYVLSGYITKPILKLSQASDRIRKGELGVKVPENDSTDEITNLGKAFNKMTSDLQEKIYQLSIDNAHRRKLEQEIKNILDAAPDMIYVISPEMKILKQNNASKRVFPHVKMGDYCYKSLKGKECVCDNCSIAKVLEEGGIHEHESEINIPDGKIIHIHSTSAPIFDGNGNITAVVEILRDVTQRKLSEEKLKESEERYRDLFENANDMIQSIDSQGRFLYVNRKWTEIMGFSLEEMKKMNFTDILHPDNVPHCMAQFQDVCNGESVDSIDTIFITKDGKEIVVEGNVNALFKDGILLATRGIFRDVTDRKKTEAILQKALDDLKELDRIKDDVISNVSHELKTPITIMKGSIELLTEEEDPEERTALIGMFIKALENQEKIVNDLITVSKVGTVIPKNALVDMGELIKGAVEKKNKIAQNKGIQIAFDNLEQLPKIPLEEEMICQVLGNIIDNAIKFNKENGEINIMAKLMVDSIEISISDTGIGIREEDMANVFKPLTQLDPSTIRKYSGTGTGLAVAKKIIDGHNGKIWAVSKVGEGTTFYIRLPLENNKIPLKT